MDTNTNEPMEVTLKASTLNETTNSASANPIPSTSKADIFKGLNFTNKLPVFR